MKPPVLFACLPPEWRSRTNAADGDSALVYTMEFQKGRGVVVKRSTALTVKEALALIDEHLDPTR